MLVVLCSRAVFCVFILPFRYWLFNLLSSVIIFQTPSSENILSSQYHFDLRTMQSRFFLWSEPSPEIRLPTCVHTLAWLQVISILCSVLCSSSTSQMGLIVCVCGVYWFLLYVSRNIKVNILPCYAWRHHCYVFFSDIF
jgi:hypothetical protein